MTDTENVRQENAIVQQNPQPFASVESIIGRRFEEILDSATTNPDEALKEARLFRRWLRQKIRTGHAHPDTREVVKELGDLIELLSKR